MFFLFFIIFSILFLDFIDFLKIIFVFNLFILYLIFLSFFLFFLSKVFFLSLILNLYTNIDIIISYVRLIQATNDLQPTRLQVKRSIDIII